MKGGAEYQADCFANYLKNYTDHDVTYVARNIGENKQADGYRRVKIPSLFKTRKYGFFVDAVSLYKILCNIKPDVILQHVACAYTGIAAFYCKRHSKSLVWLMASDRDVEKRKVSFLPKRLPATIDNYFLKYGIRNATHIVAQTKKQSKILKRNFGRAADVVIPNFHPTEKRVYSKSHKFTVLWIANIKKLKQPEIFIQLAKECSAYENIVFKIIGRREDTVWGNNLLAEIEQLNNLEYLGEMDIDEVNEQIGKSHLLVNTSIFEGFPNTFIQAWMREVPTLSLNVDPDNVIQKNNIGCYAGKYENLKNYILHMSSNTEELREAGKRAKSYAIENYSMKNADKLIEIINKGLPIK
jgi:glycosyltransferase involved in cell wall biosynthesis